MRRRRLLDHLFAAAVLAFLALALPQPAPGQTGDSSSAPKLARGRVRVFILLGQSNMLGFGKVKGGEGSLEHAVRTKGLYSYLIDERGSWTARRDVRYVRVMGSGTGRGKRPEDRWLKVGGARIGPELGIGRQLGEALEEPVLLVKSCIGNRALGWDLLPPGSEPFEFTDAQGVTWVHPGYRGSPERWKKGTTPEPIGWYAGMQYDGDVARAKRVIAEAGRHFPAAEGHEVAGFFWWQGDRDRRSAALASRYEENLVRLIRQLRRDFDAPRARFVGATLGQTRKGAEGNEGRILEAMLAVDGRSGRYPEFAGNVATVYAHPLSKGGSSGGHYDGDAETYMNVGEAMGRAMVKLLEPR